LVAALSLWGIEKALGEFWVAFDEAVGWEKQSPYLGGGRESDGGNSPEV
jgi:hypothetical protein